MRPLYDPVVRCRKDIIKIIVCELRKLLNGNPRPVAEILDDIDTLIADYGYERVCDAVREMQPD